MTRPSWPKLVAIQFGLILRSGRWIELIGGVITLLGLILFVTTSDKDLALPIRLSNAEGPWMLLVLFLVCAWPALLWRGESPRRRRYHWSLPVARGTHDLARVAAGGLWVLIVAALMATVCGLMFPKRLLLATDGGSALSGRIVALIPAGLARNVGGYSLGLLTVYCLASIAAVATARPARWVFGTLTTYALMGALLVFVTLHWKVNLFGRWQSVMVGRYGLASAIGGNFGDGEGALIFDFVAPGGTPKYGPDSMLAAIAAREVPQLQTYGVRPRQADSLFRAMGLPRVAHAGITVRQPHSVQTWYENSSMIYNLTAPQYMLGPAPPATVAAFDSLFAVGPLFTTFFNREWAAAAAFWLSAAIVILLLVSASRHEQ